MNAEDNDACPVGKMRSIVKVKLTNVTFPEVCPVCMDEAEDLVPITVFEHPQRFGTSSFKGGGFLSSSWKKSDDRAGVALTSAQGAVSFWVPACMAHGSQSIVTTQKTVASVIGFFLLFYPLLFFALEVITAIHFARPILEPLGWFVILLFLLIIDILYGFYPRALQRKIQFLEINRARNEVYIKIENPDYLEAFLTSNEMYADIAENEDRG